MKWTPEYSIGIEELDREHQAYFEIVDKLGSALQLGCATDLLVELTETLIVKAERHFEHEQAEMRRWSYPNTTAHIAEHDQALGQLAELQQQALHDGTNQLALQLAQNMEQWLLRHVLVADTELGAWVTQMRAAQL